MDFVSQYLKANEGTEVPIRYTRWSAIALLSMTLGRKVYVDHGHFVLMPWLYYCLIGEIGCGKTTAKNAAKRMFIKAFPNMPTGVSITSAADIVRFMASPECLRQYKDEKGEEQQWRPIFNFINELSNFLTFTPGAMIEFLTDIFDEKDDFVSRTIKRGEEKINGPYVALLACTPPDTMIDFLRMKVMSGGFLRRMLLIYDIVDKKIDPVTFPILTPASIEAESWCIDHLRRINEMSGQFTWAPGTKDFLHNWNKTKEIPHDPLMTGYHGKKVNIVQKIAMCIAMADAQPRMIFTEENLWKAIALLEANEDNHSKLTCAVGRNELMVPQVKLVQKLVSAGGMLPEKIFHRAATLDMGEREYKEMLNALKSTDQIFSHFHTVNDQREEFLMTKEAYADKLKNGEIKMT